MPTPSFRAGCTLSTSSPSAAACALTRSAVFCLVLTGVLPSSGEWVSASTGETLDVFNPSTKEKIAEIAQGDAYDVDSAVKAARRAFKTTWGTHTTGPERGILLNKLARLIEDNYDELAAVEALDNGKPYEIAKAFDVAQLLGAIRYFAGWADKHSGQVLSGENPHLFQYTRLEPIGVCGAIVPWNYPLMLTAWKLGPALATGNTVVLKSAENTPLSALKLFDLIDQAGFPKGVVNLVTGLGTGAGNAIAEHPDIDKISFTGSTRVGRVVMKAAANTNLKKVTLELGGKSPSVVLPDADLEQAVSWCTMGVNFNMGQTCCAGTRIYVHEDIYEPFLAGLKAKFDSIKVGDPFQKDTYLGPQISEAQYKQILHYIEVGKKEGRLVTGGGPLPAERFVGEGKPNGWFIEPTIFADAAEDSTISREEIFGPVVVVHKFKDHEELLHKANDSMYGLAAGVFSRDISKALRTAHSLQAGSVWVNTYNALSAQVPFGGYKASGIGRENASYALENYVQVKAVSVNIDGPNPL